MHSVKSSTKETYLYEAYTLSFHSDPHGHFGRSNCSASGSVSVGPSGTPTVGSKISIDVFLAPVTDLYSWQADIQYSPSTLSFASLQEGSFLSNFGPSFFIPGSIDAKNGVIADTAGTLLGNTNGPSGGGLLFTISFNVKSSGPAVIIVNNGILLDSSFNTTPAIPSSLNFTIVPIVGGTGPSSSPEPGSLAFVVAGGCLLLWLKRYFPRLARS